MVGAVKDGRSILVTGPAGTGKSTILARLKSMFGQRLAVTASTGIAALNVGGTTINTFAGLLLGLETSEEIAARIIGTKRKHYHNIRSAEILAIDEISMLSGQLLTKIDEVFCRVRKNDAPFGGVQILAFGDFCQLPPVSKDIFNPALFAFESPAWNRAEIETFMLSKVFRQLDQPFADALGHIRLGETDHPSFELIDSRNGLEPPDDGIRPVIIDTHNAHVERINLSELNSLRGKEFRFPAIDKCRPQYAKQLNRDCLAPEVLQLKVGAQVMLLANLDLENGLANGSLGVVVDLGTNLVRVRFGKGPVVDLEHHTWEIQNNGEVLASRTQFPVRLAWACTAHKVQGLTLDRIICNLGQTFEAGQGYVMVSRVKTLEGLFLRAATQRSFRVHRKAVEFYRRSGYGSPDSFNPIQDELGI